MRGRLRDKVGRRGEEDREARGREGEVRKTERQGREKER